MTPDEKLARNAFKQDEKSHITITQDICKGCATRYCLYVCPGGLYSVSDETGEIVVEYSGCLECGTCRVASPLGALDWHYPRGGSGVQYRYG